MVNEKEPLKGVLFHDRVFKISIAATSICAACARVREASDTKPSGRIRQALRFATACPAQTGVPSSVSKEETSVTLKILLSMTADSAQVIGISAENVAAPSLP